MHTMQDRKRFTHLLFTRSVWSAFLLIIVSLSAAQKIPFDNYTNLNGLPQNTVFDIDQDHLGYIWFATQVGAARFDGYEFEYFKTSDGLPDDFVNCLLVDAEGNIWLGTQGGIAVYDGSGFIYYTVDKGLVDNRVDGMIEDRHGNVWITTAYGLSVITEDSILNYTHDNALFDNSIQDIFADSKGRVHVATFPGLTLFSDPYSFKKLHEDEIIRDIIETRSGDIWYATQEHGIIITGDTPEHRLGYEDGLTDEVVLSLLEDHDGRIWCGTYVEGVFIYENETFRKLTHGLDSEPIALELYEDREHRVWLRTFEDGVWLYDKGETKHISVLNNLVNNNVLGIYEDSYGSVWLSTLNGASKYGRVIFEIFDTDLAIPENHITSVFVDSRKRIWFGAYGHLLYKYRNDTFIMGYQSGYKEQATPFCFTEDKEKNIYIGTDYELLYFNGRSIQPVDYGQKDEFNTFNSLLYSSSDHLWCGTDSGIYILKDGAIVILGDNEGLINPQVNSLEQVDDMVYCATEGGLSIFEVGGKHIMNLTTSEGLASDVCLDVTHDPSGNIWVATNRGLSKIIMNGEFRVENYSTDNGLTSNTTYFVEFADSASLWIGTERGINVLDITTGLFGYYGYDDGFRPLETNARAISKGPEGELWIGTVAGLVHYSPRYNLKDPVPPALILYPPVVDGEQYAYKANEKGEHFGDFPLEPAFPYNKSSLIFNFTGIHTTIPSQNRFSYFLEGFDDGWTPKGFERSVSYRKLPNGSYVFKVKAYNLDGVAVKQEASFAFTIKPPFWKTIWFIMLEVLAGITLVYGTIKYRERQLIREKRILEVRVKERTREIEDQKVEIEAQRDEISEQKNYAEDQRDQIAFQNKEITDSIHYAKRIQQAVLPGKLTLEQTLPDHFILFKPRDIVSGDFYWVEQKNEQVIVCVADCTGHGVPGAFMSMLGLTFLNEIVNKDGILKASEILNRLRVYIIKSMSHKDEASQARDGMDLSLVVIDRQLKMIEYAGAYNPLLILRKGEMIEYKADKMPIGKHVGEEGPFTNHKIQLEDNDMIYLFSDGFPDQFGGERGSKYKARPFKRLLQRISTEPVDSQAELLETELNTWMGKTEQVDDILVMGIRYNKRS